MFGDHNLLLESDLEIVKAAAKTSAHPLKTDTMLFSMEPSEITQLVVETERSWPGLGQATYGATEAEKKSIVFRCSFYVVQGLKVGDVLTKEDVRVIPPNLGFRSSIWRWCWGRGCAYA